MILITDHAAIAIYKPLISRVTDSGETFAKSDAARIMGDDSGLVAELYTGTPERKGGIALDSQQPFVVLILGIAHGINHAQ
jgi:hypothetical protein